jgi:hypothetical protein
MCASEQQRGGLRGFLRACRVAAWLEYRNLRYYPSNLVLAAFAELTAVGVWYFVGRFLNAGASQEVQQYGGNLIGRLGWSKPLLPAGSQKRPGSHHLDLPLFGDAGKRPVCAAERLARLAAEPEKYSATDIWPRGREVACVNGRFLERTAGVAESSRSYWTKSGVCTILSEGCVAMDQG